MRNKKAFENVLLIIIGLVTLGVVIYFGINESNQNKAVEEKLGEIATSADIDELNKQLSEKISGLTTEVSNLKEPSPDIRFSFSSPSIVDQKLFFGLCQHFPKFKCDYDWERGTADTNYSLASIFIKNFGKKTTDLRISLICNDWEHYGLWYNRDIKIETDLDSQIIFEIPEINRLKDSRMSLLYKSNETMRCEIDYTSDDIVEGNRTIIFEPVNE